MQDPKLYNSDTMKLEQFLKWNMFLLTADKCSETKNHRIFTNSLLVNSVRWDALSIPFDLLQLKFYIYTAQTTFGCDPDDISLVCMVYFLQGMNI